MPFARKKRRIAAVAQRFGDGHLFKRQMEGVGCRFQLADHARDEIRDSIAWRILARHDARACRRANAARGITLGERSAAVCAGRRYSGFDKTSSDCRTEHHVAEVIGEDEDDVGLLCFGFSAAAWAGWATVNSPNDAIAISSGFMASLNDIMMLSFGESCLVSHTVWVNENRSPRGSDHFRLANR